MTFSGARQFLTKPKPGVRLNPLHPLSKGLVGFWLFNEGSGDIANDISGNKNHGTLKNMLPNTQGSKWQGSKFGGGLAFDGGDDYVSCGIASNLESLPSDDFTITGYFKPETTDYKAIIGKLKLGGPNEWGLMHYLSKFGFKLRGSTQNIEIYANTAYTLGAWYHVAIMRNNNVAYIYINGVQQTSTASFSDTINTIAYPFYIGKRVQDNNYNFNGSIDEVQIYNRALSVEEVKQLYHDPFCNLLRIPTYYVADVGTEIKTINGLAFADIKSINGIAKASIKSVNGISLT